MMIEAMNIDKFDKRHKQGAQVRFRNRKRRA
jgi:hypothetical protein